eukprot:7640965-Ditylum_brightwellii.AAC.1
MFITYYDLLYYLLKVGLHKLQQDAKDMSTARFKLLHEQATFEPLVKDKFIAAQKQAALKLIMFLKEKHCGRIKCCSYTDGRKQQ